MEHKYITCTGYGGTGSSVISDLMKEFRSVKSCGDFEFTLSFDINGISDLQHYIVDDYERSKVGEGIDRFVRYIKIINKSYSRQIGLDIEPILDDYLNEIVDFSWMGSNHLQVYEKSTLGRIWYYKYNQTKSKLKKLLFKNNGYEIGVEYPKVLLHMSYGSEKFFAATRRLYDRILSSFDPNFNYEFLHFDQLVPVYNFKRYSKYFPNLKIICVDRDPRDLYLLNKIYWHESWIPSYDIDIYIKWFKILRESMPSDLLESNNVMFLKFEDCIYNYEETLSKIIKFIGLKEEEHIQKKEFFNPDYSIRNTKLWEKHNEYNSDIDRIAKELSNFCYSYK